MYIFIFYKLYNLLLYIIFLSAKKKKKLPAHFRSWKSVKENVKIHCEGKTITELKTFHAVGQELLAQSDFQLLSDKL